MTHSSPSRTARVRMPATSEPASGSVIPRQKISSPETPAGIQRCFCSSEPNWRIGGMTMSVWTESPISRPPLPDRPISSARMMFV